MKKCVSFVAVLTLLGVYVGPVRADSSTNRQPVADAPQTDASGTPKLAVKFQTDHWDIPPSYSRNLDVFGDYLRNNSNSRAQIIAYADNTGHAPANGDLSQKRADAIKKYLMSHFAISADRIDAKGYGQVSEKPNNTTYDDKQANRQAFGTIINPKS